MDEERIGRKRAREGWMNRWMEWMDESGWEWMREKCREEERRMEGKVTDKQMDVMDESGWKWMR